MFTFYVNPMDSVTLDSLTYFGLDNSAVAMESFNIQSVVGILTTLVEKIKHIIVTVKDYAKKAKHALQMKILALTKMKYIEMPAGQYRHFKTATDGLLDIVRFFTYIAPQLIATKVALFGKIGDVIKTRAKNPKLKIAGDILSQANTISDTLTKIAKDTTKFNLETKIIGFESFKAYQPSPNERMVKIPIAQLKFYTGLNNQANQIFQTITDTFDDIQNGIREFIDALRKTEDGEGFLSDEDAISIFESVTKMPMIFGKASTMMVNMTANALVMINMMLLMEHKQVPTTVTT